jgi:hypothetical protein
VLFLLAGRELVRSKMGTVEATDEKLIHDQ